MVVVILVRQRSFPLGAHPSSYAGTPPYLLLKKSSCIAAERLFSISAGRRISTGSVKCLLITKVIISESNMTDSPLRVCNENGITWIQLNRPEQRNALDIPTISTLTSVLHKLDTDDNTRTVVLTGTGRSFCAGADLAEWAAAEARGELETYGWTQAAHKLMGALYSLRKPTIAAVNGTAVGAGMDLSLCCDFRLAARSARFKAGYTSMGYCPDAGASWHLPRLIGLEQAKLFIFFDELWSADQALAAGMVGQVVDDEQLLPCTIEFATRLANGPTLAHSLTKQLMRDGAQRSLAEQLAAEQEAGLICGRSEDGIEALRAVAERRSPHFIGR